MLELVQRSIAPSTRKSYGQAWLEFLEAGAVEVVGGDDVVIRRRDMAVRFIMHLIDKGLSAVTIAGLAREQKPGDWGGVIK
ncbi:hypothetical protein NDU88_001615 [Pleurodeles waltl]|uniref:Core-binding (CB) domain-containing protein n=1 Tax=Pleurodeles waltl TaxID=8319 RepID=A0AAV7P794_PLEWA|nr:hypothetical protein NDU88_001615 [Pleurodeles waltl]